MTRAATRLSRVSTAVAISFVLAAAPAAAAGYLKLGDIKGESVAAGHGGQIEIESWSWGATNSGGSATRDMTRKGSKIGENAPSGDPDRPLVAGRVADAAVEREMKESGEKGGTEDLNIGVGELQEATISKSSDKSSPKLLESAVKGKVFQSPAARGSMTTLVPAGTCRLGARYPTAELGTGDRTYRMTGVVVTNCSASGSGGSGSDMRPMESISLNYEKIVWK